MAHVFYTLVRHLLIIITQGERKRYWWITLFHVYVFQSEADADEKEAMMEQWADKLHCDTFYSRPGKHHCVPYRRILHVAEANQQRQQQ